MTAQNGIVSVNVVATARAVVAVAFAASLVGRHAAASAALDELPDLPGVSRARHLVALVPCANPRTDGARMELLPATSPEDPELIVARALLLRMGGHDEEAEGLVAFVPDETWTTPGMQDAFAYLRQSTASHASSMAQSVDPQR
jgi:hypothetical protein